MIALATPTETVAQRVRRLQAEARSLAASHVAELTNTMHAAEIIAAEIAEGGEAYPAGVRDLARRFVEMAAATAQSIDAIQARVPD